MSAKEINKLQIIGRVAEGKMPRFDAQNLLEVSERTLRRYLKSYQKKGPLFLKHGNLEKAPWNKKPLEIKRAIPFLIEEKYLDFNVLHLQEKLFANGVMKLTA